MKKIWILAVVAIFGVVALAQMMGGPDVRYATLMGSDGIKGTAIIATWPSGEHTVFVQVEGLKPNSGVYANHIHYNAAGDANCKAQNGDKILGLTNLMPDANGMAVAYTKVPASVKYPAGTTYVNVHSNNPNPVGASITCGDVAMK